MKLTLSKQLVLVKTLPIFILILILTASCTTLLSKQPLQTTYYTLERAESKLQAKGPLNTNDRLPTLIVNMPKAAPGFDTQHMMYTRATHQLEYFARNEWIGTPAQMLRPLMISAIAETGAFNAVLAKHSVLENDITLESEVIKLVQNFSTKPSQVQFTLRVSLIDSATQQVIATQEFNELVNANSDNPMGGVTAANLAINQALDKLSLFSRQIVKNWVRSK